LGKFGAVVIDRPVHIEAEIRFLTTAEGGRRGPVRSGYRAPHNFGAKGENFDAAHEYPDGQLALGETVTAKMWFLFPGLQRGQLFEGLEFTVWEDKLVARARITKVLNNAMRKGTAG
jgi:hypothetical protein